MWLDIGCMMIAVGLGGLGVFAIIAVNMIEEKQRLTEKPTRARCDDE